MDGISSGEFGCTEHVFGWSFYACAAFGKRGAARERDGFGCGSSVLSGGFGRRGSDSWQIIVGNITCGGVERDDFCRNPDRGRSGLLAGDLLDGA